MRKILFLSFIVISCGYHTTSYQDKRTYSLKGEQVVADNPPMIGNEEVDPYTTIFYSKVLEKGILVNKNVRLSFDEKEFEGEEAIGVCIMYSTWKDVKLKTSWWNDKDRLSCEREMLVFHELGHCSLDLDHLDHGLMYPYLPNCNNNEEAEQMLTDLLKEISEKNDE